MNPGLVSFFDYPPFLIVIMLEPFFKQSTLVTSHTFNNLAGWLYYPYPFWPSHQLPFPKWLIELPYLPFCALSPFINYSSPNGWFNYPFFDFNATISMLSFDLLPQHYPSMLPLLIMLFFHATLPFLTHTHPKLPFLSWLKLPIPNSFDYPFIFFDHSVNIPSPSPQTTLSWLANAPSMDYPLCFFSLSPFPWPPFDTP